MPPVQPNMPQGVKNRLWKADGASKACFRGVVAPWCGQASTTHCQHLHLQQATPIRGHRARSDRRRHHPEVSMRTAAISSQTIAPASDDEETEDLAPAQLHANNQDLTSGEKDSLSVLEWPAVSKQVARLCGTVMGAQRLARGGLPLGRSIQQSKGMLEETKEALQLNLRVEGVFDLSLALDAVQSGGYLNAKQLEGIGKALQAALDLKSKVQVRDPATSTLLYPALAALAAGISSEENVTVTAIQQCIQLGSVADEASEALSKVRQERRENTEQLRTMMDSIARGLFEKGASDSRSVTLLRNRYCVGIKAGRQSDLPKGSVKLGSSQTGATMYYEPAPAIPLNNAAALLEAKETQEETAILVLLSQLLGSRAEAVQALQEAVTQLDMAAARAAHARIFGSRQPTLVPARPAAPAPAGSTAPASDVSWLWVPHAKHPLLFERSLPEPLPEPPSLDDNRFDRDFSAPASWEVRRSSVTGSGLTATNGSSTARSGPDPKALDLRVPPHKQVVAITGPNTGGKTVTLKTMGLMALMARAGMFLPVEGSEQTCQVAWFSRVLADIGDTQSLQQNLSTFSGHIKRIKEVLAAANPESLVLLDEVGSGTDPVEGAALARAILDKLASKAALTVATTHHAELKQAAAEDSRYTNVSMEFNTISLKPTYKLVWGAVGASNALDIARTLGFDSAVLQDAEVVARTTFAYQADRSARMAATAASLLKQLEDTKVELEESQARRGSIEREQQGLMQLLEEYQAMNEQLLRAPKQIVKRRDKVRSELDAAISAYEQGQTTREAVDRLLSALEGDIKNQLSRLRNEVVLDETAPAKGDQVVVPALHGEDVTFTVASISGNTALLIPEGTLGAGLQLLAMGSSRSNKQRSSTIKVPLPQIRVLHRKQAT